MLSIERRERVRCASLRHPFIRNQSTSTVCVIDRRRNDIFLCLRLIRTSCSFYLNRRGRARHIVEVLARRKVAESMPCEENNVLRSVASIDASHVQPSVQDRPKSVSADDEIARVKAECRQQLVDGEMESFKLRLNQSNHEKDELLKIIKQFEKKYRELQVKSDTDEQSWLRMKTDMSDKQRKVRPCAGVRSLVAHLSVSVLRSTTKVSS